MILFIFDYSSGTVYKHKSELDFSDELVNEICENNNIRLKDCYYMITNSEEIINI